MTERTLAVIRRAAVEARQVGHIRKHLEVAGFTIVTQIKVRPEGAEAEAFVAQIQADGGSALLLEREQAALTWQNLIPVIQRKDAEHLPADSLYGSAPDNAAVEIGHLFPKFRPKPAIRGQETRFANSPLEMFGEPDDRTVMQMRACMEVGNVVRGVICADAHLGYAQPVGGVIGYLDQFSTSGVGFDIACGHFAVKTDMTRGLLRGRELIVLTDIRRHIAIGLGQVQKRRSKFEHPLFDDTDAWRDAELEDLRALAEKQVYSIGSSNHFIDLLYEVPDSHPFNPDDQYIWLSVHFGSRALGHQHTTRTLKAAGGRDGMFVPPTVLSIRSELGQQYIRGMQLAGRYADINRRAVVEEVRRILGAHEVEAVSNHHNFAWLEEHNGQKLWVVRKGATAAFPGQRGFVGGSMGDDAVIIEGVDSEKSRASFYSTIHGAGRVMSRSDAKRSFTRHQMDQWLHDREVTLIGGDVDESPMAYRRLDDVLRYHEGTIKVVHRLRPFGVLMASAEDRRRDPYRE